MNASKYNSILIDRGRKGLIFLHGIDCAAYIDLTSSSQALEKGKALQSSSRSIKQKQVGCAPSASSAHEDSKPKKIRSPNWSNREVLALIHVKAMEHEKKLKRSDDRENMVPASKAWYAISARVMDCTGGENVRNGTTCMNKWNSFLAEYKRINDHHDSTDTSTTYFCMGPEEKDQHGVPKLFNQRHFEEMHGFYTIGLFTSLCT